MAAFMRTHERVNLGFGFILFEGREWPSEE